MTKNLSFGKSRRWALVICNGEVMPKRALARYLKAGPFITCADGGANKAREMGIRPHAIVGDLDSITEATLRFFRNVRTVRVRSQNSTDLEKVLVYLLRHDFCKAVVVGAMGSRPDHTMANFSILKKYHRRLDLVFADASCDIRVVDKEIVLDLDAGSVLSLMPLGRCEGITTSGLKYSLHREALELGVREGTSNVVVSSPVRISVAKGSLLVFVIRKI